jgi:trehalose 6-phosphate phosphatase
VTTGAPEQPAPEQPASEQPASGQPTSEHARARDGETGTGAAAPSTDELRAALEKAAKARTLLVASDFDGALAEFTVDPEDSAPAPGAMTALRGLAALPATHVAVASGRDVRTLRDLTGVGSAESITLIGSHGAEATRPHVAAEGRLDGDQRALLDELTTAVAELIDRHPGARLERKRAAVAVHTRGLPTADADAALREAAALGEGRGDVRMLRGKSVVELSVSHADKGSAIAALGRQVGSDAIFYSGDDVTDEDAFRALDSEEGDVSVKVGGGPTHAAYRVESVAQVVETLEQLRELREQATGES